MTARKRLVTTLVLTVFLGACDTGQFLDVQPFDAISDEIAIVDDKSARAALYGAYAALQEYFYYGAVFPTWSETLTDNVEHVGWIPIYRDADRLVLLATHAVKKGWEEDGF